MSYAGLHLRSRQLRRRRLSDLAAQERQRSSYTPNRRARTELPGGGNLRPHSCSHRSTARNVTVLIDVRRDFLRPVNRRILATPWIRLRRMSHRGFVDTYPGGTGGHGRASRRVLPCGPAPLLHHRGRAEKQALDTGVHSGWVRTGESFKAYAKGSRADGSINPVCRFYGPNRVTGCAGPRFPLLLGATYGRMRDRVRRFGGLAMESDNVFQINLPDTTTGACPSRNRSGLSTVESAGRLQPPLHDEAWRSKRRCLLRLSRGGLRSGRCRNVRGAVAAPPQ